MYLNIVDSIKGVNNIDEQLPDKIDKKLNELSIDGDIVVIYHNYADGHDGDYDISFAEMSSISKGFNFRVDDRILQQIVSIGAGSSVTVADLWRQIYDLESDGVLKRHYYQDFEIHHKDGGVDILLGLDEKRL